MEIIVTTISLLLFVGLLLCPIIILRFLNNSNNKLKFISYLTMGLIVTAIISLIFGWWAHTSTIILLKHYDGYYINPDSNSGQVYYDKVLPENIDRVKSLEKSHMGVGWPLKSIFLFVFSSLYLLIVYPLNNLIAKSRKKNLNLNTE
ncbi:MAG: hypothetical protein V4497_07565 [Bacteroidota bacterium]